MRQAVTRFLELCPRGPVQIVNLGCGFDTIYFWLRDNPARWRDDLVYFDVDFPEILSRKLSAITKRQNLWPLLDAEKKEDFVSPEMGSCGTHELRTRHCRFVSVDMRFQSELESAMSRADFRNDVPTIFLSECVLVYMQASHGDAIIKWAASAVQNAPSAMVVYEQTNPSDRFGKVMVENLMQRGCPLLSIFDYPSLDAQQNRYRENGWEHFLIRDMKEMYEKHLDQVDVARVQKLEFLDELEEWNLIQQHYFMMVATRAPQEQEWVNALLETPSTEAAS
jgi:tRNA wybutosine-synthesizing protein 4